MDMEPETRLCLCYKDMDMLPNDLCRQIFSSLDHKNLATAHLVCRKWRELASDETLWCNLFNERWGNNVAAKKYYYAPLYSKSSKDVYVVRHRIDRVGRALQVVREGDDFFIVHEGQIISEC